MVISLPLTLLQACLAGFQSSLLVMTLGNLLALRATLLSQFFSLNSALLFDILLEIEIVMEKSNFAVLLFLMISSNFSKKFRVQVNVRIIGDTCKNGVRKWTEIITTGRNGHHVGHLHLVFHHHSILKVF